MSSVAGVGNLLNKRIVKFLSAGALNTAFGYAVYALLVFVKMPYLSALLTATVAGVVFNYFSFGQLVFQGHGGRIVFAKFLIAYSVIYSVNAVVLGGLTNYLLLDAYTAQAICVPPSVVLSWVLMNFWVYKKKD